MNPGKIHTIDNCNRVRLLLVIMASIVSLWKGGCHIHMHQERGSQAVDVYQVFPGTYRESTADCGSRSSFLYANANLISPPAYRAEGK